MPDEFRSTLETFPNEFPQRDYSIEIVCPGCQKAQRVEWGEQVPA